MRWFASLCKQKFFTCQGERNAAVIHTEKCFVETTKIWLAQRSFLFKYGSMEILFELTKKILLIFFAIPIKKFCIDSKKHGIAN